jgi:hypothetical protein
MQDATTVSYARGAVSDNFFKIPASDIDSGKFHKPARNGPLIADFAHLSNTAARSKKTKIPWSRLSFFKP